MSSSNLIAIIGGGQAAAQLTFRLHQLGNNRPVALFSNEPLPPYQRPPLSKAYLKGIFAEGRLPIRDQEFYAEAGCDLHLSTEVVEIDPDRRTLRTIDGTEHAYGDAVFCTGSRPKALPALPTSLANVFALRDKADTEILRQAFEAAESIAIVGAGYIGLEVASVARQLDKEVTVVERADRCLARVTSPPVSAFFSAKHRAAGVNLYRDAELASVQTDSDKVASLTLADEQTIRADIFLVGIGGTPNTELAEAAGIHCDDGIVVDENGETSRPNHFAAGDCARRPVAGHANLHRLESVHNAIDQGDVIATKLMGAEPLPREAPWFWSDQYDVKFQTVGLFQEYTDHVVRGDLEEGPFTVFYFRGDTFIAADCVNDPAAFMVAKMLLTKGVPVTKDELSPAGAELKDLMARARGA